MRFPLVQALQTLLTKNQPEQDSDDFEPEKNRRVHWDKNPSIGEKGYDGDADRPQQHSYELLLALEPLLALLRKPSAFFYQVSHVSSLRP
jgi:hypothetical protein